jgi:hypothetical protein
MNSLGFIILRHVNSELTNKYWIYCYQCIRKYYPENKILIIDDNSNYEYVSNENLSNAIIIQSEYPQRGELLPYYYYLRIRLFETAVILHDSVFINQYIDFKVDTYKMLLDFQYDPLIDQPEDQMKMIKVFNDSDLLNFYNNKTLWTGCFGSMTIINYEFLCAINQKYDLSKLLEHVLNRYNRCSFERVIACILQKQEYKKYVLLGNIFNYIPWGITYDQIENYRHLPIIKVWTGR